jgi:hypothetical protein
VDGRWRRRFLACLALKALGYAIPARWFGAARASRSIDLLTVALLAALVAVQTLGAGPQIVVDARVPAIIVAAGLLTPRALPRRRGRGGGRRGLPAALGWAT